MSKCPKCGSCTDCPYDEMPACPGYEACDDYEEAPCEDCLDSQETLDELRRELDIPRGSLE